MDEKEHCLNPTIGEYRTVLNVNEFLRIERMIHQGAEAVIYQGKFLGENVVLKIRYPKKYRHPTLDFNLRFQRTKLEARILQRAHECLVNVPTVKAILTKHAGLTLKYVRGTHLTNLLSQPQHFTNENEQIWTSIHHKLLQEVGRQVGRLHVAGIAHGDLTPHNMIVNYKERQVYLIDFGLASITNDPEKFATDLFTFLKTMQAVSRWNVTPLFESFLTTYKKEFSLNSKDFNPVMTQFNDLKKRGRYRVREKGFYEE